MTTPEIHPRTARAMCMDRFLGQPALDDDLWQGADESSKSCYWEGWAFCWSPKRGRLSAVHAEGPATIWYVDADDWEDM